jgi:hypothetical protein
MMEGGGVCDGMERRPVVDNPAILPIMHSLTDASSCGACFVCGRQWFHGHLDVTLEDCLVCPLWDSIQ